MFQQLNSNQPKSNRPLKALAFGAVGLLLGIGCCGLDAHLYPHAEFGGSSLALIGAALLLLSGLTVLGALLALIVGAVFDVFRSRKG